VQADRIAEAVAVPTEKIDVAPVPAGSIAPQAQTYAIDPRANDAFIAVNRLLKAGDSVYRSQTPIRVGGADWPPGTFLVRPAAGGGVRLTQIARSLGLQIGAMDATASNVLRGAISEAWRVRAPRIGLYHAWGGNMDEGWTRWLLEQFEFSYSSLFDRDVRAGNLRARFDVILLPDATYDQMLNGLAPGSMPDAYTGGMTARGVSNLYEFAAGGGTLVAMDRAAELPLTTFGLPIRNVTAGARDTDFYIPGSLLRVHVDAANPVGYGMPDEAAAFFVNSPAFALARPDAGHVVASYPDRNLLMSGWMLGERVLAGRAAVVEAPLDKGRVVLLGFRTQHRGQPHGTFKLLFNALLLGSSERGPIS